LKYEPYKRNKAAITLMWDLDARPHEITLLKIKHIRLRKVWRRRNTIKTTKFVTFFSIILKKMIRDGKRQ
jgi:hypothetical protein